MDKTKDMKVTIALFVALSLLTSCLSEEFFDEKDEYRSCSTKATIRNFTGIDGCGYLLELEDGTMLEPVKLFVCGPPPQSIMTLHDPIADFHFEGMKVLIDFEHYEGGSVCMAGELVQVTCIQAAPSSSN